MNFVSASNVTAEGSDEVDKAVSSLPVDFSPAFDITFSQYFQKKKAALAALGQWNHINCLRPTGDADVYVQDDILRRIVASRSLTEPAEKMSLLDSVNIDRIQAMTKQSIGDVAGGSVSFIFERCSQSEVNDNVDI